MNTNDPIFLAWRDATNCWLSGAGLAGLPPLKPAAASPSVASADSPKGAAAPSAGPDLRGTELWARITGRSHDSDIDIPVRRL